MVDSYLGGSFNNDPARPSLIIEGHFEKKYVQIRIGTTTTQFEPKQFGEFVKLAQEIMNRLDNGVMEELL